MPITKLTPENQPSLSDDRLAALRALLPEAVADGKLNWEAVREMLAGQLEDEASEAAGKPHDEHFGLFWPGKRAARREAASPAKAGLHPAPGEGVDEANTRNLYLEGDNLSVLKLLRKAYSGRVKMIYIDPPYNTGNDFVYKDNFAESSDTYLRRSGQADASGQRLVSNPKAGGRFHSNWLNMIYPRLLLARELLRDDGVIFVSIDDNEVHHLRMVMDEIFGAENFVANVVWQKKYAVSNDDPGIAPMHDHILVYRKTEKFERNLLPRTEKQLQRYTNLDNDPRGDWASGEYVSSKSRYERPTLWYAIKHPKTGNDIWPDVNAVWRYSREMHLQIERENRLYWGPDQSYEKPRIKRFLTEIQDGVVPSTWWEFEQVGHNDEGQKETGEILGKKIFSTPKPVRLITRILNLSTLHSQNDIILDFFSGSATTAHAVLAQNQADGGNRRFILVQLPEVTDNPHYPTIAEIGKERIRRVITQLRSSAPPPAAAPSVAVAAQTSLALTPAESADPQPTTAPTGDVSTTDLGFKVFKLAPSVFRDWQGDAGGDPNTLLDLFSQAETPLRAGWQAAEVLAEVMLLEGFPLDSLCRPAAAFTHNTVFCVQSEVCQHRLFVCLEAQLHPATLQQLAELRRDVFICLDSALSDQAKVRLQDVVNLKVI